MKRLYWYLYYQDKEQIAYILLLLFTLMEITF